MTNAKKRQIMGVAPIAGVMLFFVASLAFGASGQMLLATYLFAHLPLFVVPFRCVFTPPALTLGKVVKTIAFSWIAFFLSALLWQFSYALLWRPFNWDMPDLPGETLMAPLFGWIPAAVLTGVAIIAKLILDRSLPIPPEELRAVAPEIDADHPWTV